MNPLRPSLTSTASRGLLLLFALGTGCSSATPTPNSEADTPAPVAPAQHSGVEASAPFDQARQPRRAARCVQRRCRQGARHLVARTWVRHLSPGCQVGTRATRRRFQRSDRRVHRVGPDLGRRDGAEGGQGGRGDPRPAHPTVLDRRHRGPAGIFSSAQVGQRRRRPCVGPRAVGPARALPGRGEVGTTAADAHGLGEPGRPRQGACRQNPLSGTEVVNRDG